METEIYYRESRRKIDPETLPREVRLLDAFLVANNCPKCFVKLQGGYYKLTRKNTMLYVCRTLQDYSLREWLEIAKNERYIGNIKNH